MKSWPMLTVVLLGCTQVDDATGPDDKLDAGLDASIDAAHPVQNVCMQRGGSCLLSTSQTFCGNGHHAVDRTTYPCAETQGSDVVCCMPDVPTDAGDRHDAQLGELDATVMPGYVCES
ncbi:MAG TPA: hypothetical protein VI299_22285, partial [Polyangiales bacterium]